MELVREPEKTGGLAMDECKRTPPPSGDAGKTVTAGERVPGTPGSVASPSQGRETRADSAARLLEALSEYERTVSMLVTAVLGLCLSGTDGDADGLRANRTEEKNRPNG